jgi:hypothetical protein
VEFSEEIYRNIQRYLDDRLGPEEREAFEREMKANAELAREVELNREMKTFLADTPENELRRNLQLLGEQAEEPKTRPSAGWWRWLVFLLPLVLVSWWLLRDSRENSRVESVIPKEETSAPALNQDRGVTPPPEKTDTKQEDAKTIPAPEIQRSEETGTPPEKSTQAADRDRSPIAANTEPIPALELLIDNNVRSTDFQWVDTNPPPDVSLPSPGAAFNFRFSGALTSEANLPEKEFQLHLFSNDPDAFAVFNPLSSFPLTFEETAERTFKVDFQKPLTLRAGLYYYLIEDTATEKIYWVGKFMVK